MIPPELPPDEAERLRALHRYRLLDTDPEAALDDLAKAAAMVMGAPVGLVSLVDADRQWFKARFGLDITQTPRDVSLCGHVVASGHPMVVPDTLADPRFADNPLCAADGGFRFYAGYPIRSVDGHVLGTLCTLDRRPQAPQPQQLALLELLATQVERHLELRRELNASRNYRLLFERSNAMPVIAGFDGYFKRVNATWSRTLGYTEEELLAVPFLDFVHPDDVEPTAHEAAKLGQGHDTVSFRNRYRHKDGSYRWLEWHTTSDTAEGLLYAIANDVTDRQRVDELKGQFVSVVSHELRTPLTSIRGSLRLLQGGVMGPLSEPVAEMVTIASQNIERLIRLINDILDLDRLESGKLELQRARVPLRSILKEAIDGLQPMAREAGVWLVLERGTDHHALVDRDRMVQVTVNLLSNALKFSPRGSRVTVRLKARKGGRVRVSIQDEGPGIAPANAARIFERFEQVDQGDDRARGGSGLGLAITRALVEEHGGRIGVDSTLGRGSTFWFDLAEVRTSDEDFLETARRANPGQAVLVVEDDAQAAHVLRLRLEVAGYVVTHVTTLAEARRALSRWRPDVVLLDQRLPDGEGTSLFSDLAATPTHPAIPVIMVSGRDADDQWAEPLWVDWVRKPVDEARLERALRRATRSSGPPRVFVVEDDPLSVDVTTALLDRIGVTHAVANSAEDALTMIPEFEPDLIVLDVGLPGLDGFGLVQLLRGTRATTARLLVYTGRDLDAREREDLRLGVTEYLTKSRVSETVFLETVKDLLDGLVSE